MLFADGDIDKQGYEFLRDKAQVDLDAATEALGRLQVAEPHIALPPLETVLAAAEGWGEAMRGGRNRGAARGAGGTHRAGRAGANRAGVGTPWKSSGHRLPKGCGSLPRRLLMSPFSLRPKGRNTSRSNKVIETSRTRTVVRFLVAANDSVTQEQAQRGSPK